jgi:hypothetical protein
LYDSENPAGKNTFDGDVYAVLINVLFVKFTYDKLSIEALTINKFCSRELGGLK